MLHGPSPAQNGTAPDWSRRLADIPNPQPQPQTQSSSMYDQREPIRSTPSQRQASPRQDQIRQYQEQHRHTPIRRASPPPPPSLNHNGTLPFSAPQSLPQPPLPVSGPTTTNRIPNPNYGAPDSGLRLATSSSQLPSGPRAPYGRGDSPPPEIRPIAEARASPPGPNYPPQQHYQQHHPNTSQSVGIAAGAPPPMAALAAAEAAARERGDDRPSTGFKRSHESDEEYKVANKHHANGESRNRLEDHRHRRASPPDRKSSPRPRPGSPRGRAQSPSYGRPASPLTRHSRSSSTARREEQRRADETYHPSEAAHHPPTLPPMHQPTANDPPPPPTPVSDAGREERREAYEAAARKMDVDEDYDDEGEEEKRKEGSGGGSSPHHNNVNGQAKDEAQK